MVLWFWSSFSSSLWYNKAKKKKGRYILNCGDKIFVLSLLIETMAELQALCMNCRDDDNKPTKQDMTEISVEEKKGRYSARGKCANCGGNMFKFLSKDDAEKLQS